jgi:transposase InsO family protein
VGPLPETADGFKYLLTAIDSATRWFKAIPLKTATTADCRDAFIAVWNARFSVPSLLTWDSGVQFAAGVWAAVMSRLGIKHTMTTAFHPQSNGLVERVHCRLKDALKARLAAANWPDHLPWVLLGLRASPREDLGLSAAEMT